jgi:hypothetical protein
VAENLDFEKIAESLAETVVVGQELRELRKKANLPDSFQSFMNSAKGFAEPAVNWAKENPMIASTLGGAALGGTMMGAGSLLGRRKGERRRVLSDALTGALGGAAVGGGGALALSQLRGGGGGITPAAPSSPAAPRATPSLKPDVVSNPRKALEEIERLKPKSILPNPQSAFFDNPLSDNSYISNSLRGLLGAEAGLLGAGTMFNLATKNKPVFSPKFDDFVRGLEKINVGDVTTGVGKSEPSVVQAAKHLLADKTKARELFNQYVARGGKGDFALAGSPSHVVESPFRIPMNEGSPARKARAAQPPDPVSGKGGKRARPAKPAVPPTPKAVGPQVVPDLQSRFSEGQMRQITRSGRPTMSYLDIPSIRTMLGYDSAVGQPTGRLGKLLNRVSTTPNPLHHIPTKYRMGGRLAAYAGIPLMAETMRNVANERAKRKALDKVLQTMTE